MPAAATMFHRVGREFIHAPSRPVGVEPMQTRLDEMRSPEGEPIRQPMPDEFDHIWITMDGRVWRADVPSSHFMRGWLCMKTKVDSIGYECVDVSSGGKKTTMRIHRLLALAWIPNPDEHRMVLHKNDVKTDNRIGNLYWGTIADNLADARRNGRFDHTGSKNPSSKLTEDQVVEMRRLSANGESGASIAEKFGVHPTHANAIIAGKVWRHVR